MRKWIFIFFFTLTSLVAVLFSGATDHLTDKMKGLKASAVVLEQNEAIVKDYNELKAAIQNNSITKIYFGADINLSSGIQIPTGRVPFTVSGKDLETNEIHTLTETGSSTSTSGTIYLTNNSSTKQITMEDMSIVGKNYYGTVYVSSVAKGVNVTYNNVNYHGPQLIWNTAGTLELTGNTSIEIGQFVSGSASAEELGEVGGISFGGNIQINHTSASSNSVVWYGEDSSTRNFFTVQDGAKVSITANGNGVFYRSGSNPINVTIGKKATFHLETKNYIYRNNPGNDFFVDEGADVSLSQTNSTNHLLQLNGTLKVSRDASFSAMKKGGSGQLIQFGSGGNLVVDDPAYFLLYNDTASKTISYSSGSGTFNLVGGVINYWNKAGQADTIGNPTHSYSRDDETNVAIGLTTNGTTTTIDSSNVPVSKEEFNVSQLKVLSIGNLFLEADSMNDNQNVLTGQTARGASVQVNYVENEEEIQLSGTADDNGNFEIKIPKGFIKPYTKVVITATTDYYISKMTIIGVEDVSPPAGTAIPQVVDIGDTLSTDPYDYVQDIKDKSDGTLGEGVTATLIQIPNTDTFGLKKAFVTLHDLALNETQVEVPVFVKDSDTVVQKNIALRANSFIVNETEVNGKSNLELEQLIKEKSGAVGYDIFAGADISDEIEVESFDLKEVPGEYTATLELRGVTKTITIEVFSRSVKFDEVSPNMDFKTAQITGEKEILKRDEKTWKITVVDTREKGANWVVSAAVTKPLTSIQNQNHILKNAFIFINEKGEKVILDETPYPVFQHETINAEPVPVDWEENRGILVEANTASVYADEDYQGKIAWTLQDAP
ncbi:hypothetical protein X560_1459 [Listeria fleischmannii 1991]|uniref:Bacterial Ig domain-containing protein n=2 Tax=Listeria fleischmannii TaxID=1069827 RepID=A0A0J8GA67_9LIST|nr:pectate lyase-like adhesive domain-containing protein [Listeria fleischmannii]KMT59520.1 hypothetical protein X560_1459 [Listeria fleischmannii 1991]